VAAVGDGRVALQPDAAGAALRVDPSWLARVAPRPPHNCAARHGLVAFSTPAAGYFCNVCEEGPLAAASAMHGCRVCDFDVCDACTKAPPRPPGTALDAAADGEEFAAVALPASLRALDLRDHLGLANDASAVVVTAASGPVRAAGLQVGDELVSS
jgi:hypothetical protein